MERLFNAVLKLGFYMILTAGSGYAAHRAIIQAQLDAKGAMKMGISYGKFNRQLIRGQ
jgi:hypothetical protein